MKKLFTLAAATTLGLASLGARAQAITVDGQITAAEVSTTGYTLVGRYTGAHGFAPSATNSAGLLSLYAASDATNLYFFLVGTLQNDGSPATISNSLQLLIARPGVAGVPVGTALPKPAATSFQNFAPFLDQVGDMGISIRGNSTAAQFQVDGVVYTNATTATAAVLSGATGVAATGTVAAVSGQTGALTVFNGAQVAYRTATSLNTNPGYGGGTSTVPASGLEIAVSRASIALPAAGGTVRIFALQNNADGGYVSTDFIPQATNSATAANPGTNPDFRAIPGTQSAALTVGATTGVTVLGTKTADAAAVALSVYPNPVADNTRVAYTVTEQASPVNIVLTDLLGRTLSVLENSVKPVGSQSASLNKAALSAGTYLVRVQVGEKVSTSKVVVL